MDEATQKVMDGTAWTEFCDLLHDAGEVVLAETNPDDPLDRAEGYRMLTRLLRGALESQLEHGDQPSHPELFCVCHETIKIVGENPDNRYLSAILDGRHDYRIRGTRGESKWLSFNLFSAGGFGGGGPGVGATLHEDRMQIEDDGTFELVISQNEHSGNWLRSEPDTRTLAIRQTFLDRYNQEHAQLHIERIGADGSSPAPLGAEHLYHSLLYAGFYVRGVAAIGTEWATRQAQWPNVFTDEAELEETDKFKDPQIKWHQAYFDLAEDEALVIDFVPPDCDYWMIVLHNHWMETLDYVNHQVTLNCTTAELDAEGRARFVVAHRDPGLPNWLDTAGHSKGTVGVRWVGPDVVDVMPSTQVVAVADLA